MAKVNQYKRLVEALDNVSVGFPSWLGVEKMALKKIYSEEDAKTFADMIPRKPQTAAQFAAYAGADEAWAERKLYDMSKRGLIFRRKVEGGEGYEYAQFPYAFGLIEWQSLASQDKSWMLPVGLWGMFSKYGEYVSDSMPLYRTVPFKKDMVVDSRVLPYDDIEELLAKRTRFAVAPCVCRLSAGEKACGHPQETCVMTDDMADFYVENGWGKAVTREEALAVLVSGKEDGRIIQVGNSKSAENICSCCTCGCGMIKSSGRFDKSRPSTSLWNNYQSEIVDAEACTGCGACEKACTWGVIKVVGGKAVLPGDRYLCMGCGLCVNQCPAGAVKLLRKDDELLYEPPVDSFAAHELWHEHHVAAR